MNRISSENARAVILQAAILALLVTILPAVAQSNGSTTSDTTTTTGPLINPNDPLLKGSDLTTPPSTYAGAAETPQVRKDAWTWYWNEKAHIDVTADSGQQFWSDDIVGNFFKNISDHIVIPFWNNAMEYDFIRAGLLLVVAGMLLGLGASLVLPKKSEKA